VAHSLLATVAVVFGGRYTMWSRYRLAAPVNAYAAGVYVIIAAAA
jgi:hypothetical protein